MTTEDAIGSRDDTRAGRGSDRPAASEGDGERLSYAQIGRLEGMSRFAVRNIVKRGVTAKSMFTATSGYNDNEEAA
jgi:hypothetical protein